ncbi:MAG: hypothetical protein RLZ14_2317, partial [Actinomycetota bacterium]
MGGGRASTDELPLKLDLPLLAVPAPMRIEDLIPSRPAAPAEPMLLLPEPVVVAPEPVATMPEPVVVAPQPVVPAPEPVVPAAAVDNAALAAAVEAELNRLAFAPDADDADLGPVELPTIVAAEPRAIEPIEVVSEPAAVSPEPAPAAPVVATAAPMVAAAAPVAAPPIATPVLQQGEQFMPKQSAAPIRHAYADLLNAAAPAAPPRRKKRRILRKLFSFLVMLGMV